MKRRLTFIVFFVLVALKGCASMSNEAPQAYVVEGQVIDADTKQPLVGVLIFQRWSTTDKFKPEAYLLYPGWAWAKNSGSNCAALQKAKTDANGRFAFSAPREVFDRPEETTQLTTLLMVAKHTIALPGYQAAADTVVPRDGLYRSYWDREDVVVELKRHSTREEALEKFAEKLRLNDCDSGSKKESMAKIFAEYQDAMFRGLIEMNVGPEELADSYVQRFEKTRVSNGRKTPYTREDFMKGDSDPVKLKKLYDAVGGKK